MACLDSASIRCAKVSTIVPGTSNSPGCASEWSASEIKKSGLPAEMSAIRDFSQ